MEKDIEEIVQCYDRFVDIVKEISMNAKEQIIKLKGTIIADELASDFSEIGMMYAKELLEKWMANSRTVYHCKVYRWDVSKYVWKKRIVVRRGTI